MLFVESYQWQARTLQHAASDVEASQSSDTRKMDYARGVRDVLAMLLDAETPMHPTLREIYVRYQWRTESLPTPELRGHEWQFARFTGTTTCSKCGLLPLDSDDYETDCPADVKPVNTEENER